MVFNVRPAQTHTIPWGWRNEQTPFGPVCIAPRGEIVMPRLSLHFNWEKWYLEVTPSFEDLLEIKGEQSILVTQDMFSVLNTAARFLGWNKLLTEQPPLDQIAGGFLSWHKKYLTTCPLKIDYAIIGDDVASNLGMMISPDLFRTWLLPHYRRFAELFLNFGVEVVFHSDGDISEILDDLVYLGISGIHPCVEVKALDGEREYKGVHLLRSIPNFDPREYTPE